VNLGQYRDTQQQRTVLMQAGNSRRRNIWKACLAMLLPEFVH